MPAIKIAGIFYFFLVVSWLYQQIPVDAISQLFT